QAVARGPYGGRYTPTQLAGGCLAIANATMVRAIRAISVARGYDPAEHVLVAFGSAAGQHACALARELRMRRVLAPAQRGVLSAVGVAVADVRRFRERSVLAPYSEQAIAELEPMLTELEQAACEDVVVQGVARERIEPPQRFLDLRYRGLDAYLTVAQPEHGTFRQAYERTHEQAYGYRHAGRELEIVAARVEAVGRSLVAELPRLARAAA